MSVIPSTMSDDFNAEESSLSRTSLRTWLNASFASAQVVDTMVDGNTDGWFWEDGGSRMEDGREAQRRSDVVGVTVTPILGLSPDENLCKYSTECPVSIGFPQQQ